MRISALQKTAKIIIVIAIADWNKLSEDIIFNKLLYSHIQRLTKWGKRTAKYFKGKWFELLIYKIKYTDGKYAHKKCSTLLIAN